MRRLLLVLLLLIAPAWAYTSAELDQMLGPIALYPDPLLAQMLPASTFPEEIQAANAWLASHPSGDGADQQGWDPSVVAIVHYSDVLGMMNENYDWTVAVGQAYEQDSAAVMSAVQRLRGEASSNGALQTTPQQTVITEQNVIRIEPADPTYVYVPSYDPYSVYAPGATWVAPALSFGLGMATGAWLNNGCNWWGGYVSPLARGYYCGPGGNYNRFVNNNININNRNEYFSNNRWSRTTSVGNRTNINAGNRYNTNVGNRTNIDRGRGGAPTWRPPGQSFNGNNWPRNPSRAVPTLNNPVRQPAGTSVFNSGGGGFDRNRGYSSINSRPNTGGFSSGSFNRSGSSGSFNRGGGGGFNRGGGGMRGGGGRRR